jgi:hypothetical protein
MNVTRLLSVISGALFALALFVIPAHASDNDQMTYLTFQQPVRIPGHTLAPGTYGFQEFDVGVGPAPNRILVTNRDTGQEVAVLLTMGARRLDPSDETIVTFAPGSQGRPPALVEWFFPGQIDGHRFLYSAKAEKRIEHSRQIILQANTRGDEVVASLSGRPS